MRSVKGFTVCLHELGYIQEYILAKQWNIFLTEQKENQGLIFLKTSLVLLNGINYLIDVSL